MVEGATEVKPLRVRPATAAVLLGLEYQTVRLLMTKKVFTVLVPDGPGHGNKRCLPYAEVEAYAYGGRKAVAKLRKKTPAK